MRKGFKKVCFCAFMLISALQACACDVPVFEYALKMWPPDAYELVVVHRGGSKAASLLEQLRTDAAGFANMALREAAPEMTQERYGVLVEESGNRTLPWLIVRYPVRADSRALLWAGPAAASDVNAWMDSPMRRKITRTLLDGSVGAWVFLESGDKAKDESAYASLDNELSRLERVLRLPHEPLDDKSGIAFKILRLSRHDPAEKALLLMLTKSEPDLESLHTEPMVFPVYGRGIVLYALVGAGINTVTITETAEFLAGECSCEIKSQNPGMELLITADWEGDNIAAAGLAGFNERADQAAALLNTVAAVPTAEEVNGAADEEATSKALNIKQPVAVLLLALLAGMIWLVVFWRRRRVQ